MLKRIIVVLVMLAAALVPATTMAQPAYAGSLCEVGHICGDFYHAEDAGFDDPIPVTCDLGVGFGNYQMVAEYKSSTCHDADGFYVGPGRNVSCLQGGTWIKYNSQGWHKFNDSENRRCVHGLD